MEAITDIGCEIIDTPSKLKNFVRTLIHEKAIGVDLEADSMYHFKEKVCLIQMATKNTSVVIDPLMIKDLSVLKPIFKRRDIQKIFHGADYDVRSLYRDFQITVNNLFDTQLASRFLCFQETGLEAVLKNKFGVSLDKKYQRKDWSKRPLPEDMIAYAAKDVFFLVPLAENLKAELKKRGRLSWVLEECEHLSKVRSIIKDSEPLYLNFKGAGKLNSRSLAVLEALLQYRRNVAQNKDKPLFRIMGSRSLMDLAVKKPSSLKQLDRTKILSPKQISMYGQEVIKVIANAMKLRAKDLPVYPRKKAPIVPIEVAERVRALRKWREIQAENLKLDPALICNKSLIITIATQRPMNTNRLAKINELKDWQIKKFGNDIVDILKRTT
jgi:ribonuclease D